MRGTALFLVAVTVVTFGLAGCQTVQEHPQAAVGAGVGAAGGALIGGLVADSTKGAVIGGLLGALAGGAAGEYLSRQDRSRGQAMMATNYSPAQGEVVRLESAETVPTTARPGQTVNLAATYTMLTPDARPVVVRETRMVRHGGSVVANPAAEFTRSNGTFTSALPITLPADAPRGQYEVTTTVVVAGESASRQSTFQVM